MDSVIPWDTNIDSKPYDLEPSFVSSSSIFRLEYKNVFGSDLKKILLRNYHCNIFFYHLLSYFG